MLKAPAGNCSDFNPRSYERNDSLIFVLKYGLPFISIHVPTRGTTIILLPLHSFSSYFNPRSYERNDSLLLSFSCRSSDYFNPRSYERNDHMTIGSYFKYPDFNPRSYERNDRITRYWMKLISNFNPRSYERNDL